MHVYESLINGYTVDEYANEGKAGDFLRGVKDALSKALGKIIATVEKVAANIAATISRLPSKASKADKNVKPIVENVDKMVLITINTFKFAIGKNREPIDTDEWEDTISDNIEKIKSIHTNIKSSCDNIDSFSKIGAKLASIGMKGWLGKLRLIESKLKSFDSDEYITKIKDQVSLSISTINYVCKCFSDASGGIKTDDKIKLTDAFYDCIKTKNLRRLRIMMKDSLILDRTFKQFNAMEKNVVKELPEIYVDHDGRELKMDKKDWTDDYLNLLLVQVVGNFSHERVNHLKNVIRYVYQDDNDN